MFVIVARDKNMSRRGSRQMWNIENTAYAISIRDHHGVRERGDRRDEWEESRRVVLHFENSLSIVKAKAVSPRVNTMDIDSALYVTITNLIAPIKNSIDSMTKYIT